MIGDIITFRIHWIMNCDIQFRGSVCNLSETVWWRMFLEAKHLRQIINSRMHQIMSCTVQPLHFFLESLWNATVKKIHSPNETKQMIWQNYSFPNAWNHGLQRSVWRLDLSIKSRWSPVLKKLFWTKNNKHKFPNSLSHVSGSESLWNAAMNEPCKSSGNIRMFRIHKILDSYVQLSGSVWFWNLSKTVQWTNLSQIKTPSRWSENITTFRIHQFMDWTLRLSLVLESLTRYSQRKSLTERHQADDRTNHHFPNPINDDCSSITKNRCGCRRRFLALHGYVLKRKVFLKIYSAVPIWIKKHGRWMGATFSRIARLRFQTKSVGTSRLN